MDRALSDWADAVLRMAVPVRVGTHPWRAVRWWAIGFAAIFLPWLMILPALVLGTVGGAAGAAAEWNRAH